MEDIARACGRQETGKGKPKSVGQLTFYPDADGG